MKRWWPILLTFLALDVFLAKTYFERRREHRYDNTIRHAATRYGVDPALVKAVIWRESRFNADARGTVGEIGLMQVRLAAATDWTLAERIDAITELHLADARTNILAGTWYLSHLLKRYRTTDDPLPYALADYNAGRTQVLRWLKDAARTNSAQFLAAMDYPGTRRYIDSVRKRYRHYQPQ